MTDLQKIHVQAVLAHLDRSYFPSVMLGVETQNPRARGIDLFWEVFQAGVSNGAELGFSLLWPGRRDQLAVFATTYQHLDKALELSEDMDVGALESLLAARNAMANHIRVEWDMFHRGVTTWAAKTMGVRDKYLTDPTATVDGAALFSALMLLLTEGRYHPFWPWAIRTYLHRKDVGLKDIPTIGREFVTCPPVDELNALQREITPASAAMQYVAWARAEYKSLKSRIDIKCAGQLLPDSSMAEWISRELFNEEGD